MTRKTPTFNTLNETSIETLAKHQPNREYLVSWNEKGDLIKLTLMGSAKPLTRKQLTASQFGTQEERESLTETCITHTKTGSMVIAFGRDKKGNIRNVNPLKAGYVMYDKKTIKTMNSLDDAVNELLRHKEDETYDLILRFKRRQNKWLLHAGVYAEELPKTYAYSKDSPIKVYDLVTRSHLWEPQPLTAEEGE